jgi:hypothetical protein
MKTTDSMMDEFKAAELARLKAQPVSSDAAVFMAEFQAVVLEHLNTKIDEVTWQDFRAYSKSGVIEVPIEGSEHWTREQLVQDGVTVGGGAVNETLTAFKKNQIITVGTIENRPVHYVVEQGTYIWALTDDTDDALELWITCPAYPPGW